MIRGLLAALLCLVPALAAANEAPPVAEDPVLEQRLARLTQELRCLVCQNESLADSHADLAADLRNQMREQMRAGRSDEQIKAWLTERYGDFVLYRTPLKATTAVLWFGPAVLLIVGLGGLVVYLTRRRGRVTTRTLTASEHARAQALLQADEPPGPA